MVRMAIGCGAVVLAGASPALAQDAGPASVAAGVAEECLRLSDAAFEQSLTEGLAQADRLTLTETYEAAIFDCLGLAMEICEGLGDAEGCLQGLEAWIVTHRAEVVATLAEVTLSDEAALSRARAEADPARCVQMSDYQRTRYCGIVSEGFVLEDAYVAWRLARREGTTPMVGHDPIDLEMLR